MKYTNYTVEEFVKDDYFQQWVLEPDLMSEAYWQDWKSQHPDRTADIEEARQLVSLLAAGGDRLSEDGFNHMWKKIVEGREKSKSLASSKSAYKNNFFKIAASLVLLLTAAFVYYQLFDQETAFNQEAEVTLELHDGSVMVLKEGESGMISTVDGQQVVQQFQKVLDYSTEQLSAVESMKPIYNQLIVPYGKKFEIILSDGSKVYLNSGTKLRYPVSFIAGQTRDVFLDGEAYFEVAKDKARPFTVITDQLNTRVYGTEFNVSSYKNENNTSTVLVEGSVGVYKSNNADGSHPVMIEPGERALFGQEDIVVEDVQVEKYIAWKDGKLFFVNDRFDVIVRELERHFNVSIDNQNELLEAKRFTGTFDVESLDQVLEVFQLHSPFEYSKENNLITIKR